MKLVKLDEVAVFLQLNMSRMGDKRGVSGDDIEVDADKSLVKVRKVIFKSAAFDRIKSLDGEIRKYVRAQCFPYETGMHLVPLRMMDQITQQLISYSEKRSDYIENFVNVFEGLKIEFSEKLRKLYNEKDYETGDIRGQFSMSWQFMMIQVPPTLEQISSSLYKTEQRKLESRMQEAFEEARMVLRETCLSLVTHLRNSLMPDNYGGVKRISTSTLIHLQVFLNNFNLRNITNDRELDTLVKELKELTNGVDAESLRTMDGFRARVRSGLHEVEQELEKAVTVTPSRRIKGL